MDLAFRIGEDSLSADDGNEDKDIIPFSKAAEGSSCGFEERNALATRIP